VSAISLWELALLIARGRVQAYGTVEASLRLIIEEVTVCPITPEIAALATQFPADFPGDSADRLIGATARAEGLTLVTRDENIRRSPLLKTVW
jgi:PIN domain nuclease of toxin-antitoxin system